MIVNKSMFPVQAGFSAITGMQGRMSALQMQLGTGQKTTSLAGMGSDLALSLSVRARLSRIEGFSAGIGTLDLRLNFLGNAMQRFDRIEAEVRTSAVPGQYGTGDINMAMLPTLSRARFDEVVTLLNADIAGRHVFGGSVTDRAPLPRPDALIEGEGGRAGFRTVLGERKLVDLGQAGLGRLEVGVAGNAVSLGEDGAHPFGFKLSNLSTSSGAISLTPPGGSPATQQVVFDAQPVPGQTVTMGFTLPDGTETQIVLTAGEGGFAIGATTEETAANFAAALETGLRAEAGTTLAAASAFAASENFFNAAGEPVLRVAGNPATATALRLATANDTVMWYTGESPAIGAAGLGRLDVARSGASVTLGERQPASPLHGFKIAGISGDTPAITTAQEPAPARVSIGFGAVPAEGETVSVTLARPDGTQRTVTLSAVTGQAGPGQFTRGASPEEAASGFSAALESALQALAVAEEGNPRQSVGAQVDEATRVDYGVAANESGLLRMVRTLAAMAVETYPPGDPSARGRFDAMAGRQQSQMSETHNVERGSVEIITMELGIAKSVAGNSAKRHAEYRAQLVNLLADVETVAKEDVAMEILALQTRLQASYQVTAMVAQLSLVKFI